LIVYEHQPAILEWQNVANKASLELRETKKYYELKIIFLFSNYESLCVVGGFWTCLFYFLLFFGSGRASSHKSYVD
jgi:hypothetical protein